jgi:DNA-binding CsgD family transcriptional regulator
MGSAYSSVAVLELSLGRYHQALGATLDAIDYAATFTPLTTLADLVEAAVRSGDRAVASAALRRLTPFVGTRSTAWAQGMLLRSQALLANDDEVEKLYRSAVERFKHCRVTPQLARTRLAYGEWLRRQRRRRDAREQLRAAYMTFWSIGSKAFAQRAATELAATGEILREASTSTDGLTAHERRIARLAADGASNPQIAVQLQISPRTVEYHLGKVFRKLGITSRTQLVRAVPQDGDATVGHESTRPSQN